MQDGLKPLALRRRFKDAASQFLAAQAALRVEDIGTEDLRDFRKSGLSRLDDLTGQLIRIHHRDPALAQELGGGGFTHAHATGETDAFQGVIAR